VASVGDLEITREDLPHGGTLLRIDGELDLATVSGLEEALERASAPLVVDLTHCGFLDSSAVRILLATVTEGDGTVALVAPDPRIRRVLEIAGLDTIVPIHSTVAEAL
jgi:anti-sigma B factor antagonist